MYSGKHRLLSVSGRNDDRWRNAPGVFWKASDTFFFNFRSLSSRHGNCRSACRHRTKFFLSPLYPFYLNRDQPVQQCFLSNESRLFFFYLPSLSHWACTLVPKTARSVIIIQNMFILFSCSNSVCTVRSPETNWSNFRKSLMIFIYMYSTGHY